MKNIRDTCIDYLKKEDIKRDMRAIIQPIGILIYNEIYVYLMFICIYHVFIALVLLMILYILLRKPKWSNMSNMNNMNNI